MYLNHSDGFTAQAPVCKETGRCRDRSISVQAVANTSDRKSDGPKSTEVLPPIDVVIITETPQSGVKCEGSAAISRTPPFRVQQSDGIPSSIGRTVPVTLGSSSFKLMPRKSETVICSPSPSRARAKGCLASRKRRAHSISSPAASTCAEAEEQIEGPASMGNEDFSSPRMSPIPKPEHEFLNLTGLSLHSPLGQRSGKVEYTYTASPPKIMNQSICRPRASSFTVYNSSPGGSIHRNNSGSLSGSIGMRTPCASNKSSPRHVPLTILSTSSQQGPSPLKCPLVGRPPFHSGLSKMLHSLDGREEMEGMASPPRIQSRSLMHPPNSVTGIGLAWKSTEISKDHLPPRIYGGLSAGSASPRTPLPRVTLTPRTPLSGRRQANSALPVFPLADSFSCDPAPSEDDVSRMMDSILQGFPGHMPTSLASPERPLPVLNMNTYSSNSLALSLGSVEASPVPMQTLARASASQSFVDMKDSAHGIDISEYYSKSQASHDEGAYICNTEVPSIKAKSVMNPCRSGEYLLEMMVAETRGGTLEAQNGTLSDIDDDEEFVLAFPMSMPTTSKKDHQSAPRQDRRVKQRRHGSSNTLDSQQEHTSATSLTSNQASSTSLFGMDIVQEEGLSVSGSTRRVMTPFSGQSFLGSFSTMSRRDGEYDSSSSLHRGKSEVSLGSLGLCLEETGGELGRDLRTPPVCIQRGISPPALAKRTLLAGAGGTQSSVSYNSGDNKSVPLAISQMMFQKN